MITSEMIRSEIEQEFVGEYAQAKQSLAEMAYSHGNEWVGHQPKEWCNADSRKSRKEARRERREKMRNLTEHINSKMAAVGPSKFVIPSFIFFAILSSVIQWVVKKIFQHYWPET